jgi:hypothetical protein
LYSFGGIVFVRHTALLRDVADSGSGAGSVRHATPLRDVADSGSGAGRGVGGCVRVGYQWCSGRKGGLSGRGRLEFQSREQSVLTGNERSCAALESTGVIT